MKEGCNNQFIAHCQGVICGKEVGCGKKICDECRTKHWQIDGFREEKGGPRKYFCKDCEPRALREFRCRIVKVFGAFYGMMTIFCLIGPLWLWK